jgi:hypothetical protein
MLSVSKKRGVFGTIYVLGVGAFGRDINLEKFKYFG